MNRCKLWFASNLLFLHYQSQPRRMMSLISRCCDLLRIYYFCTINHSNGKERNGCISVVICFEFIIFALSITAIPWTYCVRGMLWFASNLLFLHYQSQPKRDLLIFFNCCDLLRIYYFCTINHSQKKLCCRRLIVVICFEFIIFALSITASNEQTDSWEKLWFASNLLFLHYQSQLNCNLEKYIPCCDLLRIYYFCTINHSQITKRFFRIIVVICFEFIIFALSITARYC